MNAALLLTALFNGAWQGAALCAFAYFILRTQRRLNATTMFAVWSVLLGIALLLPAANYVFAARPYTIHVSAVAQRSAAVEPPAATSSPIRRSVSMQRASVTVAPPAPSISEIAVGAVTWVLDRARIVLLIASVIVAFRVAMLVRDILGMFAARRSARRIDLSCSLRGSIRRRYAFAASHELKSPCVLGFSPALIVIPEELLAAPERELLSVVLHEREHVRRYDDVQNVLHRLIDAVAFFCPGVHIALRELALYREQICDDAAVNGIGDAVSYAMTLTGMAQWAQGRGVPVPSLIFKRKQLLHRLEVLLDKAVNHSLRINRRFAVASAVAIVLAASIVLHVQVPVIAKAVEAPPPVPKIKPLHVAIKPVIRVPVTFAPPPKPKALHPPAAIPKPVVKSAPVRIARRAVIAQPRVMVVTPIAPKVAPDVVVQAPVVTPIVAIDTRVAVHSHVHVNARVAYVHTPLVRSNDIMDALDAAGMRNLSVDDLVAIRDHGVSTSLIRAAVAYFGPRISPADLVALADHGVSSSYLDSLRLEGVTGIAPASVIMLMDRGVRGSLIRAANAYFNPAPSVADLMYLSDHGVSESYLASLRLAGVQGVAVADVIRLMDHGVDGPYIAKMRRWNPRISINDIIRLHDSGF